MLYYLLTSIIISSALLNRLRGTGLIHHFFDFNFSLFGKFPQVVKVNLVWNHIYGLYFSSLVYSLTQSVCYSITVLIAYLIGESKGWGEWVGTLSSPEPLTQSKLEGCYKDNEGKKFPFIHQIANKIQPEIIAGNFEVRRKQYLRYATTALILRGFYWWSPVYVTLYFAGIIDLTFAIISPIALAILFPVACYLGKKIKIQFNFFILNLSPGWENQELAYGLLQGIVLASSIYFSI